MPFPALLYTVAFLELHVHSIHPETGNHVTLSVLWVVWCSLTSPRRRRDLLYGELPLFPIVPVRFGLPHLVDNPLFHSSFFSLYFYLSSPLPAFSLCLSISVGLPLFVCLYVCLSVSLASDLFSSGIIYSL